MEIITFDSNLNPIRGLVVVLARWIDDRIERRNARPEGCQSSARRAGLMIVLAVGSELAWQLRALRCLSRDAERQLSPFRDIRRNRRAAAVRAMALELPSITAEFRRLASMNRLGA